MKKILFSLILLSLLFVPYLTLVADNYEEVDPDRLIELLRRILGWITTAFVVIATMFLIYAGYLFMTASGDETKVTKARDMLKYALIGIAVAFGAGILIGVIRYIVGAV